MKNAIKQAHQKKNSKRQQKRSIDCSRSVMNPVPFNLLKSKRNDLERLTRKQLACLNKLVTYGNYYQISFASQQRIADEIGAARETVNRWIKMFCELGLLTKEYRHMKTCIYSLSSIFDNYWFRKWNKDLLSALKYFSYMMLISYGLAAQVTQNKEFEFLKAKASTTEYNFVEAASNSKSIYEVIASTSKRAPTRGVDPAMPSSFSLADMGRGLSGAGLKKQPKEGLRVEAMSSFVRGIPGLNEAARIRLCIFPDEVIKIALNRLLAHDAASLKKPFNYLYRACEGILADRGGQPDFHRIADIIDFKKLPEIDTEALMSFASFLRESGSQPNGSQPKGYGTSGSDKTMAVSRASSQKGEKAGLSSSYQPYTQAIISPPRPCRTLSRERNLQRLEEWDRDHRAKYEQQNGKQITNILFKRYMAEIDDRSSTADTSQRSTTERSATERSATEPVQPIADSSFSALFPYPHNQANPPQPPLPTDQRSIDQRSVDQRSVDQRSTTQKTGNWRTLSDYFRTFSPDTPDRRPDTPRPDGPWPDDPRPIGPWPNGPRPPASGSPASGSQPNGLRPNGPQPIGSQPNGSPLGMYVQEVIDGIGNGRKNNLSYGTQGSRISDEDGSSI